VWTRHHEILLLLPRANLLEQRVISHASADLPALGYACVRALVFAF